MEIFALSPFPLVIRHNELYIYLVGLCEREQMSDGVNR